MSHINTHSRDNCWQNEFLKLLPQISRLLKYVFRRLDPEKREEACQNGLVLCMLSYSRLHARGCAHAARASSLVWYGVRQTKAGRIPGGRLNCRDPLSLYAQLRKCYRMNRLHSYGTRRGSWIDELVEDKRARVPDVVAARLDFRAWLSCLCKRTRKIARDLARGCTTAETARRYRITPSRVSQIRRELEQSWNEFQHEAELAPDG
jgi:hypothetical protein